MAAGRKFGARTSLSQLIDADVAFHSAIHVLSGNRAIVETVADQWPHFRRSMGLVLSVSGAHARYWDEHAAILEAILAGDARAREKRARAVIRPPPAKRPRGDSKQSNSINGCAKVQTQRSDTTKEDPMKLDAKQIKQFEDEGWLFLPDCFSPEEVAILRTEAEGIYKVDRPQVWREKSGAPRTAFAAHTYNEGFGILGRHPRLIEPVEQLFGDKLYMHQFKINAKAKFDGDVWQWHQDYGTWARDDGMPEPKAMNISVFLDEVFTFNGPLMLIPKSHKHGVLAAGPRQGDHQLSAVDAGPCDGGEAGRRGRAGGAGRQARRRADVPRQPGARLGRQHHAVLAQDRLPDAQRGLQPHPQADPARVDRAPGLPPISPAPTTRCCATPSRIGRRRSNLVA